MPDFSLESTKLKREDCCRTKHDSAFSPWKVLIGPADWNGYSTGVEGVEKYRVHNLPKCCSSPGVYEIGLSLTPSGRGEGRNPDSGHIVVVYVGQGDNVRSRLQRYGRFGAHLENGPGLLSSAFARGYSLVFRWALMENKGDALKTEAQLLSIFDYAWNINGNGPRRADDVLFKLEKMSETTAMAAIFSDIMRKFQILKRRRVGIRLKTVKQSTFDSENNMYHGSGYYDIFHRILKFGKSQPRRASDRSDPYGDRGDICGIMLDEDSICRTLPIQGRKRCGLHKGMKINQHVSMANTVDRSQAISDPCHENSWINCADGTVCGVILDNGSRCLNKPARGRKRCKDHRGKRVINLPAAVSGTIAYVYDERPEDGIICGVCLSDHSICKRSPVHGRKRCQEHKGMRVKVSNH